MRKSKKTIIYMLVAVFVALSTVLVDFNMSYAQSSYSDVPDADWVYISGGNINNTEFNKGVLDVPSRSLPDGRPDVFVDISNCKYSETLAYYDVQSDYFVGENVTLSSDTEIVLVLDYVHAISGYQAGTLNLFALSKSRMYFAEKGNWYWQGAWQDHGSAGKIDFTTKTYGNSDYQYFKILSAMTTSSSKALEYAFMTGKMKVFSTADDAMNYLETGDTSKMAWQGGTPKQEYDSGLLLNDFDVQFHDSNKFEECYLDVKYTIPEELKSVGSYQIDMEEKFDWIANVSGGLSDVTDSHTGTNYIDVLNHADGFRIYLKDIKAIDNFVNRWDGAFDKALKRFVLGNLNYVNFPFSKFVIGSVKTSNLNIKFHLVADKKYGHYVDYNLNLLSGVGVKNSYVPDTDGNYTSNNDSKVNGHYYTDVGSDAAGNTTYNYYYYYPDGGKEKVSSEDAANNTITNTVQEGAIKIDNSPTFNNNITIEGDTISNSANSYADSKSDVTTNKSFIDKFLGFFNIIENNSFLGVFAKVFGWLPVGVSTLITTALGIIVGIRVFKFFK